MEAYPGEVTIRQSIEEERLAADYTVSMEIGDVQLPDFFVKNGVLRPDGMTSRPFAEYVWRQRHLYEGKEVTDTMCGSGILGIVAAMSGAKQVVLSDFSPDAYTCAFRNAKQYGLLDRVFVIRCDLFTPPRHRPVDVVICNAPFSHWVPESGGYLAAAVLGGTDLIRRFFQDVGRLLNPGGSLLMRYRKSAGPHNDPGIVCRDYGYCVTGSEKRYTRRGVHPAGPLTFYRIQQQIE